MPYFIIKYSINSNDTRTGIVCRVSLFIPTRFAYRPNNVFFEIDKGIRWNEHVKFYRIVDTIKTRFIFEARRLSLNRKSCKRNSRSLNFCKQLNFDKQQKCCARYPFYISILNCIIIVIRLSISILLVRKPSRIRTRPRIVVIFFPARQVTLYPFILYYVWIETFSNFKWLFNALKLSNYFNCIDLSEHIRCWTTIFIDSKKNQRI